jgi:hypothetical protein
MTDYSVFGIGIDNFNVVTDNFKIERDNFNIVKDNFKIEMDNFRIATDSFLIIIEKLNVYLSFRLNFSLSAQLFMRYLKGESVAILQLSFTILKLSLLI